MKILHGKNQNLKKRIFNISFVNIYFMNGNEYFIIFITVWDKVAYLYYTWVKKKLQHDKMYDWKKYIHINIMYSLFFCTLGGQKLISTIFKKYGKFYVLCAILFSEESVYLRVAYLKLWWNIDFFFFLFWSK